MTVAIIDTSTANISSVCYALDRLSVDYVITPRPEDARDCDRLILPGVGAAKAAMDSLHSQGWAKALKEETRPLLGVCLGMQLLFDWSVESDCALLGLIPGRVERLDPRSDGPWPHMGWNTIVPLADDDPLFSGVSEHSYVYFVHGFAVDVGEHTIAKSQYGQVFAAIARKGNVMGCQFHPERSAETGAQILKNFVELVQ
jgi:glutamine amidotransferase